mmetsp:Transcript_117624/g.366412  ORF Transcript_117624/g.366412 Transcript_117624/m.366412 type:complete len:219 (+) Transcript_117624:3-659(+)
MECSCCSLRPLRGLEGGLEPRILARQALGGLLHLFVADGHGVQLLLQLHHRGPELAALVLQVRSPLLQVLRELLGFRAQGPVLRLQSGHLVHHGEGGRLQRPLHEGLHLGAELLVLPPDLPQLRVRHARSSPGPPGSPPARAPGAPRPGPARRGPGLAPSPLGVPRSRADTCCSPTAGRAAWQPTGPHRRRLSRRCAWIRSAWRVPLCQAWTPSELPS